MSRPNPKIYGYYERLVWIDVCGQRFEVPEGIPLIRAFQFIQFELKAMQCDWSRFCFNDTIGCCNFDMLDDDAEPVLARACCKRVFEGLVVATLPEGCRLRTPQEVEAALADAARAAVE